MKKEKAGQLRVSKPGYEGVAKTVIGIFEIWEVLFIIEMSTMEVDAGMDREGAGLGVGEGIMRVEMFSGGS